MLQSSPERALPPRCAMCGAVMERASVIPGLGWFSHRIFQCERCGGIEIVAEVEARE